MSAAIVGRKVENEVLYNIDGQPIQDGMIMIMLVPKVLKFAVAPQPNIVKKKSENKIPTKKQTTEKKKPIAEKSKPTTEKKKPTTANKSPVKQSHTVFQNITNKISSPKSSASPKSTKSPTKYREPRQFKPLSEQFPNLMTTLYQQKEFTEDADDSQTSGSESYLSEREQGDDQIKEPPKPEINPQAERNVEKIMAENNKKYCYSKKEEAEKQERLRQEKLKQREKMKKYGKQQIVRAHTSEEFEQKFSWGVNQKRIKEEREKFTRQEQQVEEEETEENQNKVDLAKLFPENKDPRFKQLWREEARKAADKTQFSLHKKEKTVSPKRCKSKSTQNVNLDIELNAKQILDEQKKKEKRQKQDKLLKKHKIDYIDREAKAIISSMKKRKWKPTKEFDNKMGPSLQLRKPEQQKEGLGTKELFENAENEAEDLSEQGQIQYYQNKVKNGKVLSTREVREFKEDQEKKKQKITNFKKDLKDRKNITLKNPEPYTEKELRIKRELDQAIDVKGEVEKQIKKQQRTTKPAPKTTIEQPDLGEFIFAEAELPQYKGEYEEEQRMGFREQVEQEIKEQILMQKKKRPAVREVQKAVPEKSRKPQEREGPTYRKNNRSQPRYPVFHDLGEVQLLEDDMYNAQHSKWTPNLRKLIDNSSDEEDEKDYLEKTTLGSNLKRGTTKTYSKSVQAKKTVYFREPEAKGDIGTPYLTDQKEKLMKIIDNQKSRGQMTSDDSDTDFCQAYSAQIWLPTDPMKRDVFIMSSKELMDLPHIQL